MRVTGWHTLHHERRPMKIIKKNHGLKFVELILHGHTLKKTQLGPTLSDSKNMYIQVQETT